MPDFGDDRRAVSAPSKWPARAMIASLVTGVLLMAGYYVAPDAPVLGSLGNWNLLIAYALLLLGVILAIGLLLRRR
ncbi:cell division protein CrgA [Planobispora takensis]|uniref:Cell division protein CrgA n=1 Tax=Planobispora takensis TaxID=1367882 RepID=A0A8J3T5A8_9ACTN|nr:cell division protein CrgA [Planobispora takensis]GII04696.1 hypothetical protein Pta02_67040 [Planobispora takensis]